MTQEEIAQSFEDIIEQHCNQSSREAHYNAAKQCTDVVLSLLSQQGSAHKQQIIDAYTAGQREIIAVIFAEYKQRGIEINLNIPADDKEDGEEYYNRLTTAPGAQI